MISYSMLNDEGKFLYSIGLPTIFDNKIKKRHYYLFSKSPNYGKSTWLKQIEESCRAYRYVENGEIYQDINGEPDFILIDQFGGMKFQKLESMTDGDFKYPIKYKEPIRPTNAVIIICSNVPPEKYYAETI